MRVCVFIARIALRIYPVGLVLLSKTAMPIS